MRQPEIPIQMPDAGYQMSDTNILRVIRNSCSFMALTNYDT